ncbi:MAG TPA: histidine phosphatase family protein [Anaerolineae bacterium]|jgi:2,3-bisphosphoglycerate-dependent phosphoglycerate mutase
MELYFIRHGQSQNNAHWQEPAYTESPDPELTEAGQTQARCLAEFFANNQFLTTHQGGNSQNRYGFGLTHLYTSLMVRAVSTATPMARALGIPFAAWPEIHEEGGIFSREVDAGRKGLPGKTRSWFVQHFPELILPDTLDESGWWNRPFEAEEHRQPRADKVLADLMARHGDRPGQPEHRVAFVSHGGFFMHLMCAMLDLPWRHAAHELRSWFLLSNGSISRFDIHQDELTVCYVNRTDHLPNHLATT